MKFWKIALVNAESALKLSKGINSHRNIDRFKFIKPLHQWLLKRNIKKYQDCMDYVDIIISMSAFTIEAFINFYAIYYNLDILDGYNERERTVRKWKKYPYQRTGSYLSEDTLKIVQEVLNDRNEIAHYKPSTNINLFSGHSLEVALQNLNKVSNIFSELKKVEESLNVPNYKIEIPDYAKNINLDYFIIRNAY